MGFLSCKCNLDHSERLLFITITYLSQISFGIITSSLSSHVFVTGLSWLIRFKLFAKYLKMVSSRDGLSSLRNNWSLRRTRWSQIIFVCFERSDVCRFACFDGELKCLHFLLLSFHFLFLFFVYCVSHKITFNLFWIRFRFFGGLLRHSKISPYFTTLWITRNNMQSYEFFVTPFSTKSFQRISCVFLCCCFEFETCETCETLAIVLDSGVRIYR